MNLRWMTVGVGNILFGTTNLQLSFYTRKALQYKSFRVSLSLEPPTSDETKRCFVLGVCSFVWFRPKKEGAPDQIIFQTDVTLQPSHPTLPFHNAFYYRSFLSHMIIRIWECHINSLEIYCIEMKKESLLAHRFPLLFGSWGFAGLPRLCLSQTVPGRNHSSAHTYYVISSGTVPTRAGNRIIPVLYS